jgi:p-aminobenzoyl-glutamate transporter AbgT
MCLDAFAPIKIINCRINRIPTFFTCKIQYKGIICVIITRIIQWFDWCSKKSWQTKDIHWENLCSEQRRHAENM